MKKLNRNVYERFKENYPVSGDGEIAYVKYVVEHLKYYVAASKGNDWGKFAEKPLYGKNRQPCIKWLEKNCIGKWGLNEWGFCFDNSKDAMMFKLRWL